MSANFKKCPNGHYYQEDHCPYCASTKPIVEEQGPLYMCLRCHATSGEYNGGVCPYCGEQLQSLHDQAIEWPYGSHPEVMPICSHCGHRLRKSIPPSQDLVYDIDEKPCPDADPSLWNYQWNGKCEYCGHDYSVHMGLNIDDLHKKQTVVFADTCRVQDKERFDQLTCLSGVTIRTVIDGQPSQEVFLSTNELNYLMKALNDSPLMKQHDYNIYVI